MSLLERFWGQEPDEPETILPYKNGTLQETIRAAEALTAQGKRVRVTGKDGAL